MWDLGGQKEIRSHWRDFYDKIDCIIFVIDSSDSIRMKECEEELRCLLEEEKVAGVPVLIYANKQDLNGSLSAEEIQEHLNLEQISDRAWTIAACSAKEPESKFYIPVML